MHSLYNTIFNTVFNFTGVADRLEICSDISFDKISAGKCKKNVQLCDFSRPIGIDPQPTARGIVGKCLKILCAKVPPEEMVAAGYGGSGYSRQSVDGGGKGESVRDLWNTQVNFAVEVEDYRTFEKVETDWHVI